MSKLPGLSEYPQLWRIVEPGGRYAHPAQGRFCYANDAVEPILREFGAGWYAVLWQCHPDHHDPVKKVMPEVRTGIMYTDEEKASASVSSLDAVAPQFGLDVSDIGNLAFTIRVAANEHVDVNYWQDVGLFDGMYMAGNARHLTISGNFSAVFDPPSIPAVDARYPRDAPYLINQRCPRVVVCAAARCDARDLTVCGPRHGDVINLIIQTGIDPNPVDPEWVLGFVDQENKFMTREQAWALADEMGQIRRPSGHEPDFRRWRSAGVGDQGALFSENLY